MRRGAGTPKDIRCRRIAPGRHRCLHYGKCPALESLNDLVASITHISVSERIPDSVFDSADQVELVDIEPDDLIVRLQSGKIYKKAGITRTGSFFYQKLISGAGS